MRPIRWFTQFGGVWVPGSWQAWAVFAGGVVVVVALVIVTTLVTGGHAFH